MAQMKLSQELTKAGARNPPAKRFFTADYTDGNGFTEGNKGVTRETREFTLKIQRSPQSKNVGGIRLTNN